MRIDGSWANVEIISAPILYQGKNAAISVLRNITERIEAEHLRRMAEEKLRISENRYFRLQASLDRFSHDLFGVLKIPELEDRLVKEVGAMLPAERISLLEVSGQDRVSSRRGSHLPMMKPKTLCRLSRQLPICKVTEIPEGNVLKIGEFQGADYLLFIGERPHLLELEPVKIWLETICRYVSVLYDNFRAIEDLTRELEQAAGRKQAPSWLLRLLFRLNEHERRRLAQDLHDAALQEQIIWYRKLDQLLSDSGMPPAAREQLERISQGLLDVIYQIRLTCVDLRPPMLKEEGIVAALESMFEFTQLRSDYSIRFQTDGFRTPLSEDQAIGLYRIVQELLANASKHSNASSVSFKLTQSAGWIELVYDDDGIGMDLEKAGDNFVSMGVYGMKERVHSLNGTIAFRSSPDQGLTIFIRFPVTEAESNPGERQEPS
ncbi:sensor histidine kinase [Cohnella caldifontis]|uniref:sensor histidine kinase n=1 Tax=Cohnella caldifontis TaxID=3027471 RepID=UPI0023EC02E9|nr:sensor histidine kinase [Cohnella sp. YIM B05605]